MRPSRNRDDGFRSVAENAPEGILVARGFDTPCHFANRRAAELSGYTESELMKLPPSHLIPPDECARVRRNIGMCLTCETTVVGKNGLAVPVETKGARVVWQGSPAVVIWIHDISRRRWIEAQAARLKAERQEAVHQLERRNEEVLALDHSLERITRELMSTNTALSVLAGNLDRRRDELEKKIAAAVSTQIMPLVRELRADRLPSRSRSTVAALEVALGDLTRDGYKGHGVIVALSPTELRVALMIKQGYRSEQIAAALHTSLHTVKTHRRNIRKKLKLQNAEVSLAAYLESAFVGD
jgi:PAS domain S-box-containing protein